jgi:hypothetical protein
VASKKPRATETSRTHREPPSTSNTYVDLGIRVTHACDRRTQALSVNHDLDVHSPKRDVAPITNAVSSQRERDSLTKTIQSGSNT